MKKELKKRTNNEIVEFFSPARINLIGEHIDYVGGCVVPASIDLGIQAFAAKSDVLEIKSTNFGDDWIIDNNIDFNKKYKKENSFMNYVYGCFIELKKVVGNKINNKTCFKMILSSSIPVASGLSSSAAFGMLILEILNNFYDLKLTKIDMAKIFQKVENNFIGLNSGIMDQFAIGLGQKNKFIKLNTETLDYKYITSNPIDYKFILFSTNKSRELANSEYNKRVDELKQISKIINIPFKKLYSAKKSDLSKINDNVLEKRLKHVIDEVSRVEIVTKKLSSMGGKELGEILNQSHISLKDNYEVSCQELDFIQENLNSLDKVYGSRMIGAGFGGCLLAVVKKDFLIQDVKFNNFYNEKFGFYFDVYSFEIVDGVGIIKNAI